MNNSQYTDFMKYSRKEPVFATCPSSKGENRVRGINRLAAEKAQASNRVQRKGKVNHGKT